MRITQKIGDTQVFKILTESFIGDLNASAYKKIARNRLATNRQQYPIQILKKCRLTLSEWFAKKCLY